MGHLVPAVGADTIAARASCFGPAAETRTTPAAPAAALPTASTSTSSSTHIVTSFLFNLTLCIHCNHKSHAVLDKVSTERIDKDFDGPVARAVARCHSAHPQLPKVGDDALDLLPVRAPQVKTAQHQVHLGPADLFGATDHLYYARMGTAGDNGQPFGCFDRQRLLDDARFHL